MQPVLESVVNSSKHIPIRFDVTQSIPTPSIIHEPAMSAGRPITPESFPRMQAESADSRLKLPCRGFGQKGCLEPGSGVSGKLETRVKGSRNLFCAKPLVGNSSKLCLVLKPASALEDDRSETALKFSRLVLPPR
jgi:hypothetical protein